MSDHVIPGSISRSPPQPASASPDSILSAWWAGLTSWWNINPSLPSYSQLPQAPDQQSAELESETQDPTMEALRLSKARWRTYWLAVVLCCGGALFGYDSGVIGVYSCDPWYPLLLSLFLTSSRRCPHIRLLSTIIQFHCGREDSDQCHCCWYPAGWCTSRLFYRVASDQPVGQTNCYDGLLRGVLHRCRARGHRYPLIIGVLCRTCNLWSWSWSIGYCHSDLPVRDES